MSGRTPIPPRMCVKVREFIKDGLGKFRVPAFIIVCAALVTSNWALIMRNRELRLEMSGLRRAYTEPPPGSRLPPVTGLDLGGARTTIGFGMGEKGTIFLVVSKTCPYCKVNWPMWRSLMGFDWFAAYRVVFLDLSDEVDVSYFAEQGISKPMVVKNLDPAVRLGYNLRVTPQTILVGPDGRTRGVWSGVLSTDHLKQIVKIMTSDYNPRR